jgi:HlyD family secretion protein
MKRISVRKLLPWLVVAAVVAFAVYRLKFSPTTVMAHTVVTGEVRGEIMGTGTLEARIKTTISPRIQERLAEVLVDQGDYVKSGQLLARLDDGELKRLVEVSEAALAGAKATAVRVRVDEARAEAVEQQAKQDHKRVTDLVATKVSSQAELDKAIEQLHIAETDLQRARAATVEALQQVNTAEKNLDYQRERLGFTQILSPYDGLVTRRDRDAGGVVVPGGSLLQLVATNEIWVSAWVDETAMTGLKVDQSARVVFRSESAKSYAGEVARLGREADRETREFVVDVRVKELPENWTIGQRAEVFIETGHKSNVVLLPPQFARWRENKPGVFINDHGKARWHGVTLGLRGLQSVEVTQGLSGGEQIVRPVEGQKQPLTDGQRITAK